MRVEKAVITAASRTQRTLPLQTLVDRDGEQKSVLSTLIEEALQAGIEDIGVVICPGDEAAYREAAGVHAERLHFLPQEEPLGYGHAVWCAREFVREEPFLHMIGDHVFLSGDRRGCAEQLAAVAAAQGCSVSGVQPTRESLLPYFGAVGGQRVPGAENLYLIDRVLEKPTPTVAEQLLLIPGLRAGHYLCFLGMHVLTPAVIHLLEEQIRSAPPAQRIELSPVLDALAGRERYLALEASWRRYPLDDRYGLLFAQLALALSGRDREEVLANLCEMLAQREIPVRRDINAQTR
jgi:UTP--glucose-1-phosphate uridylyltransferase